MGERTSEERDIGSQGKQMETPAATVGTETAPKPGDSCIEIQWAGLMHYVLNQGLYLCMGIS